MLNEFSRTELLLGEENIEKLKNTCIMVLGVGGVGSHCIEALARSGVGKLILVDNDTVSLTNINRQAIAFHSTVGKYKTKVMEEQIKDICPQTEVVTYEMFVLPDNVDELFREKLYERAKEAAQERTFGVQELQITLKVTASKIAINYKGIQSAIGVPMNVDVVYEKTNPEQTLRLIKGIGGETYEGIFEKGTE